MTLTPSGYSCPTTASPVYWDENCATYGRLANYDYNCQSCTGSLFLTLPADGTKNKCLTKINDCLSYNLNGNCAVCFNTGQIVTSTTPYSCPTTTVPLDTGLDASIPNSVIVNNPSCKIFSWDAGTTSYVCYTACVNPPVISVAVGEYRCPATSNPAYLDSFCDIYQDLGNLDYNCTSCLNSKIPIKPFGATYSKCFVFIPDCLSYDSSGNCLTCKSG